MSHHESLRPRVDVMFEHASRAHVHQMATVCSWARDVLFSGEPFSFAELRAVRDAVRAVSRDANLIARTAAAWSAGMPLAVADVAIYTAGLHVTLCDVVGALDEALLASCDEYLGRQVAS